MKKYLTFILSMMLVFTVTVVPVAASETSDTSVTTQAAQAILQNVKTIFNIDDTGKEFSYNTSTDAETGIMVYDFSWTDKTNNTEENISVDKNGFVRSFYKYEYSSADGTMSKIPKISKKEALNLAYDKAITIFPDAKDEIAKNMANVSSNYGNTYNVTFDREINGVSVYDNSLSLNIDSMTGELLQYSVNNWVIHVKDLEKTTLLSKDDIQKSFLTNMPLKLKYVSGYNEDTKKQYTYLVYAPSSEDQNYYIDARTGEKIKVNHPHIYFANGMGGGAELTASASDANKNSLSDAEIVETEKHSNFITEQKAINLLSTINNLSFDKTLAVSSSQVVSQKSSYTDATSYMFNLSFQKENASCYAQFDAQTGELLRYSNYSYDDGSVKNSINIGYDSAKQKAESFLKAQKADKFKSSELSENINRLYYLTGKNDENQDSYSFTYSRLVNGIRFDDDNMQVTVDGTTGKITSYNENWSDATFGSASAALTAEKALESYVKYFDLNYYYMPVTEDENKELSTTDSENTYTGTFEMIPVYGYESGAYIDAKNGDVLGSDLTAYNKIDTYTNLDALYPQLDGHYAKNIVLKLFDMGIEAGNKNFDPDGLIPQSEFEALAQNIGGNSYHPFYDTASVTSGTEGSSQPLTRIEAIKIIINDMGYDKVAEKTDMFNCTFADKKDIASGDIGYAAMAKGFGISVGNNNKFMPNKQITYAEAFIMIYNALNVK